MRVREVGGVERRGKVGGVERGVSGRYREEGCELEMWRGGEGCEWQVWRGLGINTPC